MVNTTQTPAQVYPTGVPVDKADVIRFENEIKAGFTNVGKTFVSRAAAVSFGQGNLPSSLGQIETREGDYLVLRSPTAFSDDPLFETNPRWGVVGRYPSKELLDAEATTREQEILVETQAREELDSRKADRSDLEALREQVPSISGALYYPAEGVTSEHFTMVDEAGRRLIGTTEEGNPFLIVEHHLCYPDDAGDWSDAWIGEDRRPFVKWKNGKIVGAGGDAPGPADLSGLPVREGQAGPSGWLDRSYLRARPGIYSSSLYRDSPFDLVKSAADLYAIYDQLVADFPTYVNRATLGNDGAGNPLHQYTFNPPAFTVGTDWPGGDWRMPKVCMVSGIHGGEAQSRIRLFNFLNNMCRNWRVLPDYDRFRFGCRFVVVPAAVPSGIGVSSRQNWNNVNINRNFDVEWDSLAPEPDQNYKGPSAASELETQILQQFIHENSDALCFLDMHNGTVDEAIWLSTRRRSTLEIIKEASVPVQSYLRSSIRADLDPQAPAIYSPYTGAGTFAAYVEAVAGGAAILVEQSSRPDHPQLDNTRISHNRLGEVLTIALVKAFLDRSVRAHDNS